MSIDMMVRDKVKFIGATKEQNKWGSCDNPNDVLDIGNEYVVSNIEVHSWHTKIELCGIKGKFNSVCFEKEENKI